MGGIIICSLLLILIVTILVLREIIKPENEQQGVLLRNGIYKIDIRKKSYDHRSVKRPKTILFKVIDDFDSLDVKTVFALHPLVKSFYGINKQNIKLYRINILFSDGTMNRNDTLIELELGSNSKKPILNFTIFFLRKADIIQIEDYFYGYVIKIEKIEK